MQRAGNAAGGIYKQIKCEELYSRWDYSVQFMSQIKDQWCADMDGSPIMLKKLNPFEEEDKEYDYFFVLDFCEHFKAYNGRSDCKSINETLEVIN